MWLKLYLLSITYCLTNANLEGPFLFFGPKSLVKYKQPELMFLDQDDLTKIYEEQAAIVVFNNQESVPLSSGYFPRLWKLLEEQTLLDLSQDLLDVQPDYVNNETQTVLLQGPWSERDAQVTETFALLQAVYGVDQVLGILGKSVSAGHSEDYEGEWRMKRQAEEGSTSVSDEGKPDKALPKFALYNATSILLYSSGWPELRWQNGSTTVLNNPVGEPFTRMTRRYIILTVRFADGGSTNEIILDFFFKLSDEWWTAFKVEVRRGSHRELDLKAPSLPNKPSAATGKSYRCSRPVVFSSEKATLTFPDIQIQPCMNSTEKFSDAFDCPGSAAATDVPMWLVSTSTVTIIVLLGLGAALWTILKIKTRRRAQNSLPLQSENKPSVAAVCR